MYRAHVMICGGTGCTSSGSMKIADKLEEEIANSRKYYNGTVKVYNTKREMFPSNIVAKWFKFDKKPLFEVDSAEERKTVKVSF